MTEFRKGRFDPDRCRVAVEFRGQLLIITQTRQWDLGPSQPEGPEVCQ